MTAVALWFLWLLRFSSVGESFIATKTVSQVLISLPQNNKANHRRRSK